MYYVTLLAECLSKTDIQLRINLNFCHNRGGDTWSDRVALELLDDFPGIPFVHAGLDKPTGFLIIIAMFQ